MSNLERKGDYKMKEQEKSYANIPTRLKKDKLDISPARKWDDKFTDTLRR